MLIHDDSDLLDVLTRIFEALRFDVAIAATPFAALLRLAPPREYTVIIAGWDAANGIGAAIYKWVLAHRYDLRGQFIFLADEEPEHFDDIVEGRCLLVDSYDLGEIVGVAEGLAQIWRERMSSELPPDAVEWVEGSKPSLLLVEDEPLQLSVMKAILVDVGFSVTSAESGKEAMAELELSDFDVILSDWFMPNGSGGDLYEWLLTHRPHLTGRCVFMSGSRPAADLARRAPGRPLVPKGQDSPALVHQLMVIAEEARTSSFAL